MSYFISNKVNLLLEVSMNRVRPLLGSVTISFLYFKLSISFIFIVFVFQPFHVQLMSFNFKHQGQG